MYSKAASLRRPCEACKTTLIRERGKLRQRPTSPGATHPAHAEGMSVHTGSCSVAWGPEARLPVELQPLPTPGLHSTGRHLTAWTTAWHTESMRGSGSAPGTSLDVGEARTQTGSMCGTGSAAGNVRCYRSAPARMPAKAMGRTGRKCARPRGLRGGRSSQLRLREGSASGGGLLRPRWPTLSPTGSARRPATAFLSLKWPGGCGPCACKPRPRGHERQRRCGAGSGREGLAAPGACAPLSTCHSTPPGVPAHRATRAQPARFLGSRAAFCTASAPVHVPGGPVCGWGGLALRVPGDEGGIAWAVPSASSQGLHPALLFYLRTRRVQEEEA